MYCKNLFFGFSSEKNLVEAISTGATSVIEIIAQIGANLIVFLALLGFIDAVITWFGANVGVEGLTLEVRKHFFRIFFLEHVYFSYFLRKSLAMFSFLWLSLWVPVITQIGTKRYAKR